MKSKLVPLLLCACLGAGQLFAGEEPSLSLPVNINTADAKSLSIALNGVGEKRAQAIIDYRDQVGGFKSVDELTAVKGIGRAMIEKNRERMVLK